MANYRQKMIDAAESKSKNSLFTLGRVQEVPENTEDSYHPHVVKVNPRGDNSPVYATVPTTTGEVNLPAEGSLVVIGRIGGGQPFALPIYAGNERVREYEEGTRIVGHSESNTRIEINPDGEVKIVDTHGNEFTTTEGGDTVVKDSGGATVRLKSNGDIVIDSSGDVFLGDESGTNPVARKGDSVEVEDPDSGTITGEITGGSNNVNAN